MTDQQPPVPAFRQLMWVAAGVAGLTLLVLAASWLFSPHSQPPGSAAPGSAAPPLREEQIQDKTFAPEKPQGAPATAPIAVPPPALPPTGSPGAPSKNSASVSTPPPPVSPPPAQTQEEVKPKASPTPVTAAVPKAATREYGVQVGAFGEKSKAAELSHKLTGLGYHASVVSRDGKFKVIAGGYPDRPSAQKALDALGRSGLKGAFIVPAESSP